MIIHSEVLLNRQVRLSVHVGTYPSVLVSFIKHSDQRGGFYTDQTTHFSAEQAREVGLALIACADALQTAAAEAV